MKIINKYVANDGREFNTERHCLAHEKVLIKIENAHKLLGKRSVERHEDSCDFANGGGYIQHTKKEVLNFKKAIVELCKKEFKDKVFRLPLKEIHPGGFGGRIIDESSSPLRESWSRLFCIDEYNREWGQPFYALNPTKGVQEEWTKTK